MRDIHEGHTVPLQQPFIMLLSHIGRKHTTYPYRLFNGEWRDWFIASFASFAHATAFP
jgi:hypothetical protein